MAQMGSNQYNEDEKTFVPECTVKQLQRLEMKRGMRRGETQRTLTRACHGHESCHHQRKDERSKARPARRFKGAQTKTEEMLESRKLREGAPNAACDDSCGFSLSVGKPKEKQR